MVPEVELEDEEIIEESAKLEHFEFSLEVLQTKVVFKEASNIGEQHSAE